MRITGRERAFLTGGAFSLGAVLIFHLAVYPALQRSRELGRLIPQKERELRELRLLRKEFDALKEMRMVMVQKVPENERALAPLARLDGWIEGSNPRQNIRSIKPSSSLGRPGAEAMTVEVLMEKEDLPQLVRFLYEVQSSPGGLRISRMVVKPRDTTPRFLDVTLQMSFYQG